MTIDDFLGATNIQFMEDVFGATKRQSMAMLGRRSEDDDETANIKKPTLATHVHAASARVPLLELLHTVRALSHRVVASLIVFHPTGCSRA